MSEQAIPFEIHITTSDLSEKQIDLFVEVCEQNNGKALLIELSQGRHISQPMFSKIAYLKSLEETLLLANKDIKVFAEYNFPINRIKIEIPSEQAVFFQNAEQNNAQRYFEWHGKIAFQRVEELEKICTKHKAHLSQNALKNEKSTRFITLREFGTKAIFEQRIQSLSHDLEAGNWQLIKQQSEYCLYDTNTVLDEGWLSK